jgi:DNA-binding MarR family transcriptional regulator
MLQVTPALLPQYFEAITLLQRAHRHLLEMVQSEFDRDDLSPSQALMIFNIGDRDLKVRELRALGCFHGYNVSHSLTKLVRTGFLNHQRSTADRRVVRITLTEKGRGVRGAVAALLERQARSIERVGGLITPAQFPELNRALAGIDRFWTDQMRA